MSDEAIARYPQVAGNPLAMAMLAKVLLSKGNADDAFALARAAVDLAPEDMQVRDVVHAGLGVTVPLWHGPMLHDEPRNRCYAQALQRAIRPGMQVLEIGSGAGLLSLLAARAGARVYTCDANPIVAAAAREIAARNGFADRITVIPKPSEALLIGEDLPGPSDLLMSELFDDTLFGDKIIPILQDAKRLLKPGAPVVPRFSELRCALVEHPLSPLQRPLASVEGFDLSPFNILAPARALRANRKVTTLRSQPVSALAMDYEASPFGATSENIGLRSSGGRVDGFAQWMRIDFGGGILFENDLFSGAKSHWGVPLYMFANRIETKPGDAIEMKAQLLDDRLSLSVVPAGG